MNSRIFVNDFLRDSIALRTNDYNYGLLSSTGSLKSHEVFIHIDSQEYISVKLTYIRAITAGGARMEIVGDTPTAVRIPLSKLMELYGLQASGEYQFYVTLSVNYNVKEPFGEALTEETPPRYPYSKPQYRLNVIPSCSLNHLNTALLT